MAVASGIFKPLVKHLNEQQFYSSDMIDVCSGSGIPAQHIFLQSGHFHSLILTDKFPINAEFSDARINYMSQPYDVLKMTFNKAHCYTMLNAFHHFNKDEQNSIIQKCEDAGAELYIVEILEPSFICLLKVVLAGTLGVIFLSPFIGKMNWKKFLLTYILPINILSITIDGVISVFKSKSRNRFMEQIQTFSKRTEVIRMNSLAGPTTIIHIKHDHQHTNKI